MVSFPNTRPLVCVVEDGNGKPKCPVSEAVILIAGQGAFCYMAVLVELLLWPLPHLEGPYNSRYLPLAPSDHSCRCLWSTRNTNMACSCIHQQLWSSQQILDPCDVVSEHQIFPDYYMTLTLLDPQVHSRSNDDGNSHARLPHCSNLHT